VGPDCRLIWYPVRGSTFWFISSRNTPDFSLYVVCSLEKTIWLAAATGTVIPTIFRPSPCPVTNKGFPRSAPPQERQAKTQKPVLWSGFRSAPLKKRWVALDKISIYIVKVNFSKFVAFFKDDQKFFKMVAVHIEGPMHSPIFLFDALFSWYFSFKYCIISLIYFSWEWPLKCYKMSPW
jgi:hypothetical protein